MHGKGRGFHKRLTDRAGVPRDTKTLSGIFHCGCGATLHSGDTVFRVGNDWMCCVCAIMVKNKRREQH